MAANFWKSSQYNVWGVNAKVHHQISTKSPSPISPVISPRVLDDGFTEKERQMLSCYFLQSI